MTHQSSGRALTVPELAARWGVKEHQILAHIKAKTLIAFDVSRGGKLPRWRIAMSAIEAFEQARSNAPVTAAAKPGRKPKRTRPAGWIEYF